MEKLIRKPVNFSWLGNNHSFRWNEPKEWYETVKWLPSAMAADINDATDCRVARNKKTGQLVIEETILRYDDIVDPNGMKYSERRYLDVTEEQASEFLMSNCRRAHCR